MRLDYDPIPERLSWTMFWHLVVAGTLTGGILFSLVWAMVKVLEWGGIL